MRLLRDIGLVCLAVLLLPSCDPSGTGGVLRNADSTREVYTELKTLQLIDISDVKIKSVNAGGKTKLVWTCKVRNNYKSTARIGLKVTAGLMYARNPKEQGGEPFVTSEVVVDPNDTTEAKGEAIVADQYLGDITATKIEGYTIGYLPKERTAVGNDLVVVQTKAKDEKTTIVEWATPIAITKHTIKAYCTNGASAEYKTPDKQTLKVTCKFLDKDYGFLDQAVFQEQVPTGVLFEAKGRLEMPTEKATRIMNYEINIECF